ncbi:hypothetical protein HNQ77_003553 [Silvibacterium bohemicum]|uniref:Antitoxin SocA-like Panacea domain-containing protein n=1 Tax=Silvibacterium bohemicum TaxID=1577686 RepID=A0A841JW35_9BACT|nr:type II toxin-antitoxin system antitoxin SocA domain-containing protein [Silvibacterium bohemicum]MBB6145592.1 hypothetical protein [Silvibacterium bohemicum]
MSTFKREKFKTLVHFICSRCENPSRLGATKLNKVIWYTETSSFLKTDEPLTGVKFVKGEYGPRAHAIVPVINELVEDHAILVKDAVYYGKPKKEYISLTEPQIDGLFTAQEISLIDRMITMVCDQNTAKSVSDATHNEIWKAAEIGEEIPIYTVLANRGEITEEDVQWADRKIAELTR